MKTVTVTISRTGERVEVDADGFVGDECQAATENLQLRLGGDVVEVQEKTVATQATVVATNGEA